MMRRVRTASILENEWLPTHRLADDERYKGMTEVKRMNANADCYAHKKEVETGDER